MEAILKEDTALPGTPTKRISGFGKFALAVTGILLLVYAYVIGVPRLIYSYDIL